MHFCTQRERWKTKAVCNKTGSDTPVISELKSKTNDSPNSCLVCVSVH